MMLDENYQVALVGSGSPKYLWILSRTPAVDTDVLDAVVKEASDRGYDTSKLIWVDQDMNSATVY
jgi:lipocalin